MTENPSQSPENPPSAADLLGPHEVLTIQEQGHRAALFGDDRSTCPWPAPDNPADKARQVMWGRGYAMGLGDLREARDQRESHASPLEESGPASPG